MKKILSTAGLICTLLTISMTIRAQAIETLNSQGQAEEANSLFEEWSSDSTGGAAVAVVKDGEVVFSNAYGMANLEYGIPNSVHTIFHAASLSKQFTAYSILLLEQDGKLSLNDDVRTYIPEVPDFGKKITLRHLASHTSGLRDQWRLIYLGGWRPDDVISDEDILDLVSRQNDLNFDPGSQLMYSNTGFTLLAEVAERVSGKTFAEFTKERIFDPLGMTNSQFYDDHNKIVQNRAYSYKSEDGIIKKDKLNFSTVGATSLFTTVMDLSKWAIYLNTLSQKDPALAQRMNTQMKLNNGETTEAAMGQWAGVKYKGMEWFDHTGSDASFRAYLARFPESNSAVVVLANTTPFNAFGKGIQAANVFLSEYFKTEKETEESAEEETGRQYTFIHLSNDQLERFTGTYWEPEERYDREIKVINDTLIYYRSASSQTKLMPVSSNEFKMLGDSEDVSVFFEKDKDGATVMRLNINDERTIRFIKYDRDFPVESYAGSYYSPEVNGEIKASVKNGSIYFNLFKQDSVELQPVKKDVFTSSNRNFGKVEFLRDAENEISGFLVSNGGVIDLRYSKK